MHVHIAYDIPVNMEISFTDSSLFLTWQWENIIFHKKVQGSDNGVAKCFISSNKNMTTYKRQINNSSEDLQKLCRENMKKK